MSTRLPIVQAATERPVHAGSLRVALVNMPFATSRCPSIQLGLLQAVLQRHGIDAKGHYPSLAFAETIGWSLNEALSEKTAAHLLGEWMFAAAAFGPDAPDAQRYLDDYAEPVARLCKTNEIELATLIDIRDRIVPEFLQRCLTSTNWSRYDVVGFSSVFQQNCAALAFARLLKEHHPDLVVVFGGANFEQDMGLEYVRCLPWIDYAVLGEGEIAFVQLLDAISSGDRQPCIPGVAYAVDGEVRFQGPAKKVRDLDDLPPPNYDDFFETAAALELPAKVFDEDLFGGTVLLPFESARGCWWGQKHHCTFCGLNGADLGYRSKSARRVLADMDELASRYGVYDFFAVDNILDHKQIPDVFGTLTDQRKDYSVFYEVKANLNPAALRTLSRAGVKVVQPGIESLNTHVLQLMNKGISGILNVRFLKWANYYGLTVLWNILRGFPGETVADYEQQLSTLRLIRHLQPPIDQTIRIRLDRFSPNFEQAAAKGFHNVRPSRAYLGVYSKRLRLDRIAYMFEYDYPPTLPDDLVAALDDEITAWRRLWHDGPRPQLVYRRLGGRLLIIDARDPHAVTERALEGAAARVYEACMLSPSSPAVIDRQLRQQGDPAIPRDEVAEQLEELTRLGLTLHEDGRYLSLALPSNPHW